MGKNANVRKARDSAKKILESVSQISFKKNLDEILNKLGLRALEYDPEDLKFDKSLYEEFKNASGFLLPEHKIIFVNKTESPGRKRFTIAHEIGHFVLKHNNTNIFEYSTNALQRNNLSSKGQDPQEIEANAFAAELLMPENLFRFLCEDVGLSDQELAYEFGVTTNDVEIRKESLNININKEL